MEEEKEHLPLPIQPLGLYMGSFIPQENMALLGKTLGIVSSMFLHPIQQSSLDSVYRRSEVLKICKDLPIEKEELLSISFFLEPKEFH